MEEHLDLDKSAINIVSGKGKTEIISVKSPSKKSYDEKFEELKSNSSSEKIETNRFGHTTTLVSSSKIILFGGAKKINEFSNEIYMFNLKTKMWTQLSSVTGDIPCARAAHAAVCVDKYKLMVFGGVEKNGSPVDPHLLLLDLTDLNNPRWKNILEGTKDSIEGRYGHSIEYIKPHLIVFGGCLADGSLLNDLWVVSLDEDVLSWKKINIPGDKPSPRMYHSMTVCRNYVAKNIIFLFGGRGDNKYVNNDLWALRRHRNGTWEWSYSIYKQYNPSPRFQHTLIFYKGYLILLGGKSTNKVDTHMPVEVYNIISHAWSTHFNYDVYRHSSWIFNNFIFCHGGSTFLDPQNSSDVIIMFNINHLEISTEKNSRPASPTPTVPDLEKSLTSNSICDTVLSTTNGSAIVKPEEKKVQTTAFFQYQLEEKVCSPIEINMPILSETKEYGKKLKKITAPVLNTYKTLMSIMSETDNEPLYEKIIKTLLQPSNWKNNKKKLVVGKFPFRPEHIIALTKACQEVVMSQPMVLELNAPIKIFGDIHGQYDDLMRFFEYWGEPNEGKNGDISSTDYLFLGDFVDRGNQSLEAICLLMALKLKYPHNIHLIRGNHEDKLINKFFGFYTECDERLYEEYKHENETVFYCLNEFFEYLPLAAIIDNQVICLHGGIGGSLTSIEEIKNLQRPLEIVHEIKNIQHQIVMDILWSDPTENDTVLGIHPNLLRDTGKYGNIVKYGPDKVKKFLNDNKLSLIIRAHECVLDGFERFANGDLITVFSATDYCRKHKNAGAMLLLTSNLEIIPHLIYPINSQKKTWMEDETRPPTPLRKKTGSNK